MGRRARAALAASGLALGCGRSELTIPGPGSSFADASETDDAGLFFDGGVGIGPEDAPSDGGPADHDAEIFSNGPPDADAIADGNGNADGNPDSDGGAADGAGGLLRCGPVTCGGCCAGDFCSVGTSTLACGVGGQTCVTCGPEVSCAHGACI